MQESNNSWMAVVSKYNHPDHIRSWTQVISNFILFALGWFLMIQSFSYAYWLTLLILIPVAGILVRIFIMFHDCGHGSFFKSKKARDIIGSIAGILTFTPYSYWTMNHKIHHKTAGNLDKRGIGDVWTMTVNEYFSSTMWQKVKYRFYRHPVTMFGLGSLLVFLIFSRFTHREMDTTQRIGVYITNFGLLTMAIVLSLFIGFKAFLMIQIPLIWLSGIIGFWLFYVQHQFDPSYWTRTESWDYKKVALEGSSFYKLPPVLRWFTGSIGFHHVHHLSPMIPNYFLRKCHKENEIFNDIKPLTIRRSLKALKFRLWDEDSCRMVSFREAVRERVMVSVRV